MNANEKRKEKQGISLKDVGIRLKDLRNLENFLIAVPHCDKHKKESCYLCLEDRTKEAEELEDSWKTCKKCRALRDEWWRSAWKIQGSLFRLAEQ